MKYETLDTWANPPNGQVFWTRKNGGVAFIWFTFYISLNITMVTISTIHCSCIYCFSSSFSWIISLIILRNERGWIWRILIKVNPCVCGEQWNFNRLEGDVTREGWFSKTTLHCDICEGYYLGLGRSSKQDPPFWYFRCLVSSCFTPSSFCRKVFPWMSSASGVSQCCFLSNGTFNNMVTHICAISMKQCMQATNKGIVLKRINEKLCIGLRCLSSTRVFYCSPDNN